MNILNIHIGPFCQVYPEVKLLTVELLDQMLCELWNSVVFLNHPAERLHRHTHPLTVPMHVCFPKLSPNTCCSVFAFLTQSVLKRHLTVSICIIFFMIQVEHFFLCILDIWVPSFVTSSFHPFLHFFFPVGL